MLTKQVLARLMDSKFSCAEIEAFDPVERWIAYGSLFSTWTSRIGAADAEALVDKCVKSGELEEYHPFTKNYLKKDAAVFSLSQINFLERNVLPAAAALEINAEESHKIEALRPPPTATPPVSQRPKEGNITRHKLRKNSLDAPIIKVIGTAKSLTPATVFVHLRELAIGEEKPFTGKVEKDALFYTNDKNEEAKLTKDALKQRLKNHFLPASSGG